MDKAQKNPDNVLDTFSPALKYEAMLQECGGPGPTEDRLILVFKVMDQLIPHMGVFTKIMQMCRDELFAAVYSEQYTASKDDRRKENRYIQKIPFFVLVKKVYDERDERNESLSSQLELLKKRFFDKQHQFEQATETIEGLEKTITELNNTTQDLDSTIAERNKEIDNLQKTMESNSESAAKQEHQLSCDIAELAEDLQDARTENTYLKQFKAGYDDLQQAFQEKNIFEEVAPRKKKKAAIATKWAHIVSDVESCNKTEEQILQVQNANIEEYDKFLEEHKVELAQRAAADAESEQLPQLDDMEIDRADQQLQVVEDRFKRSIADIATELELLRQHRTGLQEQIQILEASKASVKRKKKASRQGSRPTTQGSRPTTQGSRPTTQETSLSHGLDDDEDDENPASDPFVVQERVFSKFAAMLYTSDNGKTFHEFKTSKYCQSCGEKTVLCPHKILQHEHIFQLPHNVTHLKVTRPKVRINMEMMDNIFRMPQSGLDNLTSYSNDGKRLHPQVSPLAETLGETPAESLLSSADPLSDTTHFTHSIQRLWDDYKIRTDLDRAVPRPLPCPRALSLIEQFAAYLVRQDESHHEDEAASHILDTLYVFMSSRYQRSDIAYLVTHDLISALVENCATNKFIWLFTQVLIGNLDASVFRYMLLVGDFINQVEWHTVEDFRAFAEVIYQTLNEDDLENLQMGYISFSENKISKSLVAEYIIYTIMKYREPRFLDMEQRLLSVPGKDPGHMTEQEFTEVTDQILPVPNNKLRKRLYREALTYVTSKDNMANGVPILRLAQMTSYLQLLDIYPVIMENVGESVEDARQLAAEAQDINTNRKRSHEVPAHFDVIGMADVRILASNTKRRDECRELRLRGLLDDY